MNKDELREEFKRQTGIKNMFYKDKSDFSIEYFTDEYVEWLEKRIIVLLEEIEHKELK